MILSGRDKIKMEKEIVKFEVDVAFDDESFEEVLERLGREVPNAFLRIVRLVGSGGGWPTIEVIIPKNEIRKFAEWYCRDDADELEIGFLEDAVAL
jgi:hypothetical protein